MFNLQPQPVPASFAAAAAETARWSIDDDVALGCECANPALQIERWGQEAAAHPIQEFN